MQANPARFTYILIHHRSSPEDPFHQLYDCHCIPKSSKMK